MTARKLLNILGSYAANQITLYRFNVTTLTASERYRRGRITGLEYVSRLVYHYAQMEKRMDAIIRGEIVRQMKSNAVLPESEYKQGLYDGLNDVLDEMQKMEKDPEPRRDFFRLSDLGEEAG